MKKKLEQVNSDLLLINTPDWGIVNGSASRLQEFIMYYNTHDLEESVKSLFIDLICSSMDDYLMEKEISVEIHNLFSEFLNSIEKSDYNLIVIKYWLTLDEDNTEEDPFPVSDIMRRILDKTL